MTLTEFHTWQTSHCPRLLDGMLQWIMSSLLLTTPTHVEGAGHGTESGETTHSSSAMVTLNSDCISQLL